MGQRRYINQSLTYAVHSHTRCVDIFHSTSRFAYLCYGSEYGTLWKAHFFLAFRLCSCRESARLKFCFTQVRIFVIGTCVTVYKPRNPAQSTSKVAYIWGSHMHIRRFDTKSLTPKPTFYIESQEMEFAHVMSMVMPCHAMPQPTNKPAEHLSAPLLIFSTVPNFVRHTKECLGARSRPA